MTKKKATIWNIKAQRVVFLAVFGIHIHPCQYTRWNHCTWRKGEKGKFIFDGLTDEKIRQYIKIFWDCANNKTHVSSSLLKEDDIKIEKYKGNSIILFHIPRAARTQRPVYRTTNPYNGTFKRNDEGDYKCTEQEVRRMFADADDSSPRDSKILKGFTIDDIDNNSVRQYRNLFGTINPTHPWLTLDDMDLLKS